MCLDCHTDSCIASQGEGGEKVEKRERETQLVSEAMENLSEDNDEL